MERNSVITNYDNNTDVEILDVANETTDRLESNVAFTLPAGKIEKVRSVANDLKEARIKAANGGKIETHNKNSIRDLLLFEISDLAKIVNQQAKGNVTMLLSSGFPLKKENETYPEFPAPDKVKLTTGITHGEVVVEVPVNKNTRMYCIYHTPMPASADMKLWTSLLSTKHKATITDLTPGTQVAIRAGYIGTNGKINLSETFTIFVQ